MRAHIDSRLYYALQLIGWLFFSAMHVLFSAMYLPFDMAVVFNGGFIGAAGFLCSHLLRQCYRTRWFKLERMALLIARALICVAIATALWEALIVFVLHMGMLKLYDWDSMSKPAAVFWYYYYFVALSLWSMVYFASKMLLARKREAMEKLKLELSLKESQLQNLKWQMNPHFLFNSLNSVRAMINENPARAREMVTQLAGLLRHALSDPQSATVSLGQELESVQAYLAIEKVRFEQRLEYQIDIAADLLQEPVLPMSLQTLVENAIKHGISQHPAGGMLSIRARREERALVIHIENPGRLAPGDGNGLGLKNTRERLHMAFGERSGVELRQADEQRVEAVIRVERA
ncbi:sensor histidine kinase [Gilvimarinus algae]|uniref:Histidine kinase n=1 Tax=Gilvimarinus algae TaxID=3058037 RepID=A0ABT8TGC7_9GAMM|nr:histidine kinase [Gilvimarinus sp. SDUM040014]MDO3381372.1 histidine kinase [Gilvimarinus sp. SDUM040014]